MKEEKEKVTQKAINNVLITGEECRIQSGTKKCFWEMLPPISLIRNPRIKTPATIWRFASVNHVLLYGVIGVPLLFSKIWRPLCGLFVRHGCFLIFKFTLATGVFARAGIERDRYSKTSESGVDICEENSEKNTEIPPRLISKPGREKQDKWTVGEKLIA